MSGLLTVGLADYFASWDSPLLGPYAASLTAIRRASTPGVGRATALFTTSTTPISAAAASSEAEKPDASVSVQIFGDGVYQPVHEERWVGWVEAAGVQCAGAVWSGLPTS